MVCANENLDPNIQAAREANRLTMMAFESRERIHARYCRVFSAVAFLGIAAFCAYQMAHTIDNPGVLVIVSWAMIMAFSLTSHARAVKPD